jgi:glycosyltransferase involved in cell wall biosynthesis
MHILLIHQAFAALDEAGGTRHHELALSLVQRGHRVTVIASPVSYMSGTQAGKPHWIEKEQQTTDVTILRAYTYPAFHRSFVHRVLSFLSFMVSSFWAGLGVHEVDLVWGTSPPIFQGVTAWALARLKRVPFLFEVRDLWPAFAIAMGVLRNPGLIRASLWLEGFLYRRADRVAVNSPGYIEHVKAHGARRVELIPNGADPAMFDPDSTGATFRQENGLEGKFLVVYAGAHGISNDLGIILQAAHLLENRLEICFVLVGDGKEKSGLEAQALQMGLKNLIFLPPVPKNGMSEVLGAADACIAILKPIELYKTTYPNKVFDYMAAGRPVVLAIDGVIRQVIEAAGAGIPVGPGNPAALAQGILRLAANQAQGGNLGRQMGLAGRAYIEKNLSRAQSAEMLTRLLEEMWRENGRKNSGG